MKGLITALLLTMSLTANAEEWNWAVASKSTDSENPDNPEMTVFQYRFESEFDCMVYAWGARHVFGEMYASIDPKPVIELDEIDGQPRVAAAWTRDVWTVITFSCWDVSKY